MILHATLTLCLFINLCSGIVLTKWDFFSEIRSIKGAESSNKVTSSKASEENDASAVSYELNLGSYWLEKEWEDAQEQEFEEQHKSQGQLNCAMIPPVLAEKYEFLRYVDVFYGTEGGGHMFPGVTVPFGMCKMGVDVINSGSDAYSGYDPNGEVCGVSMLHESGTGGSPTYGVVSQLPMLAEDLSTVDIKSQIAFNRSKPDFGHIGYYQVNLYTGIKIEFSASARSGLYRYTFPVESGLSPVIMVNLTQHLHSYGRPWWTQNFDGGYIQGSSDMKSYQGKAYFSGGWSDPGTWSVSFYGVFDQPAKTIRAFHGSESYPGLRLNIGKSVNVNMGILFQFRKNAGVIKSHVGVSFSPHNGTIVAKDNLLNDYPSKAFFDFNNSVSNVIKRWDDEVFSKVVVNSEIEDPIILEKFYTSLYGAHFMPTDKSGKEAPWSTEEPYYDDWFTLWDTFRCLHPLINLFNKKRGADMVRSLIEIWRREGFMPDGRSAGRSGRTQGGSNSDIVLADAFIKGINSGIDWEDGLKAMQTNAEVIPPYIRDPIAPDSTNKFGRGALQDWLNYGYITRAFSRSVTRTMEYSYNDFALHVVAKGLGHDALAQRYLKRSSNWQKIWNFEALSDKYNYRGFVQPKDNKGNFYTEHYDPLSCFGCYWQDDEYEGKPIEYGWAVPHDILTLKAFIGSDEIFAQRLDDMFGLYGDGIADIGNEPSFLTPYLFNFINRQFRTSETIDYLIENKFLTGVKGLPGNSDAGAMQAWLWFGLTGFYPIAGTDIYLITSPKISYLELRFESGKITIQAYNLYKRTNPSNPFSRNVYIRELVVNGKQLPRNWLTHQELFEGFNRLEFFMTDVPTPWDAYGELPPSRGHIN